MENMLAVTLVLCAFCFYIGYAVGSDRTTDKMLKKNLSLTDRLNDALAKNETLQKKVSELERRFGISQVPDSGASSNSSAESSSEVSVQKEIMPPESDYEEWYSSLFVSASNCSRKSAKTHSDEETVILFTSFFDIGLFTIVLMTENHDFARYCFSSLQKALAESPVPSSYQQFINHYDYIIDIYNKCVSEKQTDAAMLFRAITESSVDYFYKKGDDLERSYQVQDALLNYALSISQTFKEEYSQK